MYFELRSDRARWNATICNLTIPKYEQILIAEVIGKKNRIILTEKMATSFQVHMELWLVKFGTDSIGTCGWLISK